MLHGPRQQRARGEAGQASVEWIGLILIVALLMAALVASGARVPGASLAGAVADRIVCAVSLGARCSEPLELTSVYGEELADRLREYAPALSYGAGAKWIPADFRDCFDFECAEAAGEGRIAASRTGEPATVFTRVIDCRGGADEGPFEGPAGRYDRASEAVDCGGDREGRLYLAYWFYYPDSATFEGVPVLEDRGFHPHDWESFQVRIDPDGRAYARASSHQGHNHRRGVANWASDAGIDAVNTVVEAVGARPPGGWGEFGGWLHVTAGSHAGNVADARKPDGAYSLPEDLRFVPLEPIADDDNPDFSPIVPPWGKALWIDPEARHTG